jgi:multimeric flavodoxin WrbA
VKTLLIVWYSRTGASEALAIACADAASKEFECASGLPAGREDAKPQARGFRVVLRRCDEVRSENLLGADAFVFICPENLGTMAGAMKEFFDRNYYLALDKLNGRGYACVVAAGSDGQGAVRQIERIALGWRLKKMADSLIVNTQAQSPDAIWAKKTLSAEQLKPAQELGQLAATGLVLGIY